MYRLGQSGAATALVSRISDFFEVVGQDFADRLFVVDCLQRTPAIDAMNYFYGVQMVSKYLFTPTKDIKCCKPECINCCI